MPEDKSTEQILADLETRGDLRRVIIPWDEVSLSAVPDEERQGQYGVFLRVVPVFDATIALEHDAIASYLDAAIRAWRRKFYEARAEIRFVHALPRLDPADFERGAKAIRDLEMASHYVDAFQSVRSSLLGETLEEDRGHG